MSAVRRIAIVAQGTRNWIGGIEYTRNLIYAASLSPRRADVHLTLILHKGMETDLYEGVLHLVDSILWVEHPPHHPSRIVNILRSRLEKLSLRTSPLFRLCKAHKIAFVFPVPPAQAYGSSKDWAGWIPDFQHCALPEFFSEEELKVRNRQYRALIQRAPTLILSSEAARQDLEHYFGNTPAKKVFVLPFCSSSTATETVEQVVELQHRLHLPDKYLILSNQFWQHKNHITALRALALLKDSDLNIPLVLTGSLSDYRQPKHLSTILDFIHSSGLQDQIWMLGLLPRSEQWQLLRRSAAIIQPSRFEGWSTVVEDAKALGKHIFLSNLAVHIEQKPAFADYFAPLSPEDLAAKIAARWPLLKPGPDLAAEAAALQELHQRQIRFGEAVLTLSLGR